jgi:hypothetical protein avisC_08737
MSSSSESSTTDYVMNKKLGAVAMLLASTGMGLVGTLSRHATAGLNEADRPVIGSFLAFGRMTVAMIGFIVIVLMTRKLDLFRRTRLSTAVVMGGVSIGLSLGCYITSTLMTSLVNAVFLIYTGPMFCTILARIFRKERISVLGGIFLSLVFVGMLLTIGVIDFKEGAFTFGLDLSASTPEFPRKSLGDLFGLLSGIFYGLAMFFYGYRKDVDSAVRGVWNFFWASFATLVMSIIMRPWHGVASFTTTNWIWAAALFIVCGLFALGFLIVAGRNLPAVEYSTISYWECPVVIVLGLLVWHEPLSPAGVVGGLLVIGGGMAPIVLDVVTRSRASAG